MPALRVAIADDDASSRHLLEAMFRDLGHDVVVSAKTCQELIDRSLVEKPDLILTDNLMPDMYGVDAAAAIYEKRPTPIILLSGTCDPEMVLRAESQHVLVYLVKPVTKETLSSAIDLAQQRHEDFQSRQVEPRVVEGRPVPSGVQFVDTGEV